MTVGAEVVTHFIVFPLGTSCLAWKASLSEASPFYGAPSVKKLFNGFFTIIFVIY